MKKKYFTAKTYQNYERIGEPFLNEKNKLVTKVRTICPRCNGKGIIISRVENGKPIPVQPDGGICYQCLNNKYIEKTVRLYTDKEFETKERAAKKAKEKKKAEQEKKMKAEFAQKKQKWLEDNGFNTKEETYVYFPSDSYEVKDQLKQNGFRFNSFLYWHCAEVPAGYEDKVIKIFLKDVAKIGAWGTGHFLGDAKTKVEEAMKQARPQSSSQWIGEIGERLREITVSLVMVKGFESQWGYSQIVKFEDENQNILKWFTTVDMSKYDIGDNLLLSGTIKDNVEDKYENDAHVTLLTRCRLKVV